MPQTLNKFLNIGCGKYYAKTPEWVNIDFYSSDKRVISHNLIKGIPFPDKCFDLVYHSHVLEHFSKEDGKKLILECHRVLKPGGILRIVIPDLETIARLYLYYLEQAWENPKDETTETGYEWILLEMYDQCVRSESGGAMKRFLQQQLSEKDSDLIQARIGREYHDIMDSIRRSAKWRQGVMWKMLKFVKGIVYRLFYHRNRYEILGRFRMGGEIHQWMYDKYSLRKLLTANGFGQFEVMTAFTSKLPEWSAYQLDGMEDKIRKPDSLFIEAIRN
jgi:predicted SAM-dependent methyltransferase